MVHHGDSIGVRFQTIDMHPGCRPDFHAPDSEYGVIGMPFACYVSMEIENPFPHFLAGDSGRREVHGGTEGMAAMRFILGAGGRAQAAPLMGCIVHGYAPDPGGSRIHFPYEIQGGEDARVEVS